MSREKEGTLSVAFYPCGICEEKPNGKLAQIYWAWFTPDGGRHAIRQRLCAPCFVEWFAKRFHQVEADPGNCPFCGGLVGADLDTTFATLYIPGKQFREYAIPTCANDAVALRYNASKGAIPLADRMVGGQGSQPTNSATSAWDELGLAP